VLVAGASGVVGYAAVKHFIAESGCDVVGVSRRMPLDLDGAAFVSVDLNDADACRAVVRAHSDVTHLVYAALFEKPGLVAGWRERDQMETNLRMFANLLDPLVSEAAALEHVALLQGTKAYGSHVRPMKVPAREGRSDRREIPNFYWNQEDYLRSKQNDKAWHFTIFRPVLIVGYSQGSAMNVVPAIGVYAAMLKEVGSIALEKVRSSEETGVVETPSGDCAMTDGLSNPAGMSNAGVMDVAPEDGSAKDAPMPRRAKAVQIWN